MRKIIPATLCVFLLFVGVLTGQRNSGENAKADGVTAELQAGIGREGHPRTHMKSAQATGPSGPGAVIPFTKGKRTSEPEGDPYLDIVRVIYTRKFGVQLPVGFAYSARAQAFVVLEAERVALSAEPQLRMVLMDLSEEPVCSRSFPFSASGRLDVAVTGAGESLLIQDALGKRWLRTSADCREQDGAAVESAGGLKSGALKTPGGATAYDPQSGDLFTMDARGQQIHRTYANGTGELDGTAAQRKGRSSWLRLQHLGVIAAGTLAIHPQSGHFFVLNLAENKLLELNRAGTLMAARDLSPAELVNPLGMAFAPSGDSTDDPANIDLYIADSGQSATPGARQGPGKIVELELVRTVSAPAPLMESLAAVNETGNLVNTIQAWQFNPPAPDTAGVEYVPATDTLWIADSEVDEMSIFKGVNVFESTRSGSLTRTHNTIAFTREPTGIAYDTVSGHFFISSDSGDKFYEVTLGADGLMGTADDVVRTFSAAGYGCGDPEGIAYDSANRVIYLGCGVDAEVVVIRPGLNGQFDGPSSDDVVTHFDTNSLGVADLEGIGFNPDSGTLFLASRKDSSRLFEVSTSGTVLRTINISAANAVSPAGVGYGTGSAGPGSKSLYLSDRGIDNNQNSKENDGMVYEFALAAASSPLPTISSFTPGSGIVGTGVTIQGNNFTGTTAVKFNGAAAAFTVNSSIQITTSVPSGATTGKISVSNVDGTGQSTTDFTAVVTPTISSFSPTSGGVGNSVTITGSGFAGTTAVAFNGTPATVFTVNSNTQITATVPAAATTGKISVTNPAGTATSTGNFTVIAAPGITSFTPTIGPVGTSVAIAGSNFTAVSAVAFNGTPATTFTVNFSTQITATVPAGATTGKISVTNADGTGQSATDFTVVVASSISSFNPGSGPVGTSVTINGSGFAGVTQVKFNGTLATSFTVNSNTSIQATVPSGATTGPITVSNAAGTASSATSFVVPSGGSNLLLNPGFELDANNDSQPDNWSSATQFSRSNAVVLSGSFSGRHFSTTNSDHTITQKVSNLTAGTTYNFKAWVNIPSTSDAFTLELQVRWRNSSGTELRTDIVKAYTGPTGGWDLATANLVAPTGTTNAVVRMKVKSLNATIYVDDTSLSVGP